MTSRSRTEACRSGMLARPTLAVVPKTVDAVALRTRSACCLHMPASATSSAIRNSLPPMRATTDRDKYCRAEHQRWRLGRDLPRRACAPIAGGPGQSMPKLTCAPRKLAWAPMARNVVWLVPSCLQRLSTRVGGPVKLVAGKLIYTAWASNSLSAARIFGDSWRRETGLEQHMREQSASAVAADRDAKRRSTRWQQKL
jgi:hypothetical protein